MKGLEDLPEVGLRSCVGTRSVYFVDVINPTPSTLPFRLLLGGS